MNAHKKISKIVVLGAGVMGTGIAALCAEKNLEVSLLDRKYHDDHTPNKYALEAIEKAKNARRSPFSDPSNANLITTGNFEDDLQVLSDADWVIEVIIENEQIKKDLYTKLLPYLPDHAILSSNTSGIAIGTLSSHLPDHWKARFIGTHFFNPVHVMPLMEIIPSAHTDESITKALVQFGEEILGKVCVLCKDTPGFIANRIGFVSSSIIMNLNEHFQFSPEKVDFLFGPLIGRPKTGVYRLRDLAGLDIGAKVRSGLIAQCPEDEFLQALDQKGIYPYWQYLMDQGHLGNKTGQGFYKKLPKKDENGRSIIHVFDLKTLAYRPMTSANFQLLEKLQTLDNFQDRLELLLHDGSPEGKFVQAYFEQLLAYCHDKIPEIADDPKSIDDAMKAGYAWQEGPFEMENRRKQST